MREHDISGVISKKKRNFAAIAVLLTSSIFCQADEQKIKINEDKQADILTLTDENIQKTIESSKGRLAVQFSSYDRGCGYCAISNSPFEKLVTDYSGVRFARITREPWRSFPQHILDKYKLYGLPALILFKDGKEEFRMEGWTPAHEVEIRDKFNACCKH
jgi:hypothetical protein